MTKLSLRLERLSSPIGLVVLLTDERDAIRAIEFEDHEIRLHRLLRRYYGADGFTVVEGGSRSAATRSLEDYFSGNLSAIDKLTVAMAGTPFQLEVWGTLREIRAGQTLSYGALALRIGRPSAVRAVGLANGANPIPIVVPCHRVIGADHSLTGYGGGLERKRWLLQHEGVQLPEQGDWITTTSAMRAPASAGA